MAFTHCCCFSLRTGALLIGILEFISWCVAADRYMAAILQIEGLRSETAVLLQNETNFDVDVGIDATLRTAFLVYRTSFWVCVIKVVIACILLVGVQMDSIPMISSWIIGKIMSLIFKIGLLASIFYIPGSFTGYTYAYGSSHPNNDWAPFGITLDYALDVVLSVYFILVAHSLIKEIRTGKDRGSGGLVHKL